MREQKYRLWDKRFKAWVVPMDFAINGLGRLMLTKQNEPVGYGEFKGIVEKDGYELMQFTGLHDKNGKEIFEGDIVKVRYPIYDGYDSLDGVVEYDAETTAFRVSDKKGTAMRMTHNILEIIGNIHENPELLKGEGGK